MGGMLRNYWTMAIRMLVRHPGRAAITIGGLALGLAGCLLILNYIRYERSYDTWLADGDRVFQVQTRVRAPGTAEVRSQASAYPLYDTLPGGFPQIEAITSVGWGKTVTEQNGQPIFLDATSVDRDFFKVFPLPFVQGSAGTALRDPKTVVLTEKDAVRLVGTTDAIGKTIVFGAGAGRGGKRISGVIKDLPRNTSLKLGVISLRDTTSLPPERRQRAREVALRKVFGASRRQLIVQFVGEGLLVAAVATMIALTIAELATPTLGRFIGADLHVGYLGRDGLLLPAIGMFLLAGLASGLYPAFVISRFRPARVLHASRGSAETPGGGRLRTVLVVVQFAIAIGLIASTAVIWSQTQFVERVDPGYRRDGLVQIDNAWRFTQGSEYEAARAAMRAIPGVTVVGRTGLGLGSAETTKRLTRAPNGGAYATMSLYSIDAGFLPTMGVDLLAGRPLGDVIPLDRVGDASGAQLASRGVNVIVNRTAAAQFGFRAPKAAIGQTIQVNFGDAMAPATIVGVVEDTRFRTARDALDPIVYSYDPERTSQVVVRYAGARPGEVMAALNKVWRRYEPEIPFEARFADDIVHDLYAAERGRTELFAAFSGLAVLIACLGLYALAAFATERRTKEIGIRKVLGAKVIDIVRLIAWQFSKPVVLANLIAWPIGWWAMRDWLNTFDLRIALTPVPFLLAGLLALAIALATVASHSLRVARTRPIDALRYE
ncbi:FtsX-like permease family protein [Sphingomonas sp. ASY06-1R]|uniref:ABC transporter permease n=1 Tax=Sphingomonas sp. ASY06-1R TaxID=3445771 RepID=UPI003FA1D871